MTIRYGCASQIGLANIRLDKQFASDFVILTGQMISWLVKVNNARGRECLESRPISALNPLDMELSNQRSLLEFQYQPSAMSRECAAQTWVGIRSQKSSRIKKSRMNIPKRDAWIFQGSSPHVMILPIR